jgi:hypothetical protein
MLHSIFLLNAINHILTPSAIKEKVIIYNKKRPHLSNHMLTPNQMHEQSKLIMKTYKTKNSIKNVFCCLIYLFLANNLYRLFRTSHFIIRIQYTIITKLKHYFFFNRIVWD